MISLPCFHYYLKFYTKVNEEYTQEDTLVHIHKKRWVL